MERIVKLNQLQSISTQKEDVHLTGRHVFYILAAATGILFLTRVFHDSIYIIYDQSNYLALHTILEFLSINVALLITIQGLIVFPYEMSKIRLFMSGLFFVVGSLDLLHTLSYDGMPFFITDSSVPKATWFWILARSTESLGLLWLLAQSDQVVNKRMRYLLFGGSFFYVLFWSILVIYFEDRLPILVIEGVGLTSLKKGIEYIISAVHLITMLFLIIKYRKIPKKAHLPMILSLGFLFLSEWIFTVYQNVYVFDNLLGHFYKAIGYIFLLRGIYVTTIQEPFIKKQIAEQNQLKSQQQLLWMLERIPGAFFAIDKEAKLIVVNRNANDIFFKKKYPDQLLGMDYKEVLNEILESQGVTNHHSSILQSLEDGSVYVREKIKIDQRVYQADVSPIIDPETGEILGAGTYFFDITDEDQAYMQWNELFIQYLNQAENLQQLIDTIPIGFLAIDHNEKVIAVNEGFLQFSNTKSTKMQMVGEKLKKIHCEKEGSAYEDLLIVRALRGEEIRGEVVMIDNLLFLVHAHPIRSAKQDRVIGAVASYQNVTEIEKLRGEMDRLDRLHVVSQMAASITHEIRNPMAAVRGFIQLLQEKAEKEFQDYYQIILSELDRANQIINDFLALSRTRKIEKDQRNLNQIVEGLQPILMADANIKGQHILIDLDENLPHLLLNENEIKQLILNLARNGMESMESSGTLTIRTQSSNGKVELHIEDEGEGIAEEQRVHLFEPFFTTKEKGTGLGLAVCKNIVDKHNGKIKVESEVGVGTSFSIYFTE